MITTKAKVSSITVIEKIKTSNAKNNAKTLPMIDVPQIAMVTPAIINKTKAIIFIPRK